MEIDTTYKATRDIALEVPTVNKSINLYKTPPFGQLTLEECEDLFRQRLEALTIIEKSSDLSTLASAFRDIKSHVYKSNCILLRANDAHQSRLDHYSHMLMRMYSIYNPNLWDWFKTCEKQLLYFRLRDQVSSLSGSQLATILTGFNFEFQRVIGAELCELHKDNLLGWAKRDKEVDIFKVKFTYALKFIAKRSVALKDGFAFLTRFDIISVICDVFEKHLENELIFARQHFDITRAQQLLDSLTIVHLDFQDKIEEEKLRAKRLDNGEHQSPYVIDLNNVEELVKQHYPPCMRYMHEALMEDHHLKHQARLYYGAFLRSGGVDMDSAIEFWRKEFTKKIASDKFERDYKYNIRHLYGREGHKKALSCFSCDKIINDNPPGPSEKHGCPFRHFDDQHLRAMLVKHNLKDVDIESIFISRNSKEYRSACSDYFKFTRGHPPVEMIKNPIHFYYESMRRARQPIETLEPKNEDNDDEFMD